MEPQSGKSVVALGLMELLSPRVERLGFFGPIVPSADSPDPQIDLVPRWWQVDAGSARMRSLTQDEARVSPASDASREASVAEPAALRAACGFFLWRCAARTSAR